MKGHIRQRGERSWEIKFDAGREPATGKRLTRYHSFKGTKREAQVELTRLMAEAQSGRSIAPNRITVSQFLDEFERDWAPTNVSAKTRERYGELLRVHVRPHLGDVRLQQLEPADLNRLYLRLAKVKPDGRARLSARTIGHAHRVVHKALEVARGLGLVARNVAADASPPRPVEQEIEILTEEQVGTVLGKLRGRALYPLIVVALATGMRRGELLALKWEDIDLDAGTCRIDRSVEEPKAGVVEFKGTKTRHGRRTITLPAFALAELKAYRASDFWIYLNNETWKLRPSAKYEVTYHVDALAKRSGTITVASPTSAVLHLPSEADVFAQLQSGRLLQITTPAETLSFRLDGTKAALAALSECVDRNREPGAAEPAGPKAKSAGDSSRQALRVEALQMFANLFAQGGFEGFRILGDKEISDAKFGAVVQSAEIVWTGPGVVGLLHILAPNSGIALDQFATSTLTSDASQCKGKFFSGNVPDDAANIRRVFTSCSDSDSDQDIRYIFVRRADGSIYRITTIGAGTTQSAPEADKQIRGAIRSM